MTPLIVVLPFCQKDLEQARELLLWINEIRPAKTMPIILMPADAEVDRASIMQLKDIASQSFAYVRAALVPTTKEGWPPNQMFLETAKLIKNSYRLPFLWLEPDCIPLVSDWYFRLESAYEVCPKKFMGTIIHQDKDPTLPKQHLTGCSIYPQDAVDWFKPIIPVDEGKTPWDIGGADKVVLASMDTDLIYHVWGTQNEAPTFVVERGPNNPRNAMVRSDIPRNAVLFHRCKDGSLIRILRSSLSTSKESQPKTPQLSVIPPIPTIPAVSEVE